MNGKPGTEKRAAEKPFLPRSTFPPFVDKFLLILGVFNKQIALKIAVYSSCGPAPNTERECVCAEVIARKIFRLRAKTQKH